MNKTKIATYALGSMSFYLGFQWQTLLNDLYGRFPNHDRKVIRKAYRRMLIKSAAGKYPDLNDWTDEQMDQLFLIEYNLIAS